MAEEGAVTAQQIALGLFFVGSLCFAVGNALLLWKAYWP